MKKVKDVVLNLFDALIKTAPKMDISTRCQSWWGEPDYPEEEN